MQSKMEKINNLKIIFLDSTNPRFRQISRILIRGIGIRIADNRLIEIGHTCYADRGRIDETAEEVEVVTVDAVAYHEDCFVLQPGERATVEDVLEEAGGGGTVRVEGCPEVAGGEFRVET